MKNHVAYKLQDEEVNALYANALVANISVIITVVLFFFIAKVSGLGKAVAIIWVLSMIIVAVLRLLLYQTRLIAPDKYSSKDWLKNYTVLTGIMGCGWAAASFIVIFFDHTAYNSVLVCIMLFFVIMTAIPVLSFIKVAFYAYIAPPSLVLMIMPWVIDYLPFYLGIGLPVWIAIVLVTGNNFYNRMSQIFSLEFQNERLEDEIIKRIQVEEDLSYLAHHDALTNLPNRFLALDRLSQLINEAHRDTKRVAVLFLDLDDFKKVNDTLGHDTGDKLLIEAAERLCSDLRSGDTVGRLGGDEFIILLGGLDEAADISPIAANLLKHFIAPFIIENRELVLTSSIGISIYPDDGDSSSQLLRNADSAMYHSKKLGRNTYSYFTEAMNQEVSRRLALEEQMHGALERGEFRLCYQPQMDVSTRRISGVEALLRWNNPVLGNVSPDEFISIAEQTGQIVPIGQFVLIEALTMAVRWQSMLEQSFTMAVNLSPIQFRAPNLVTFIEQSIEKSGISSQNLELEVTEGVLISGYAYIEDALTNLSNLGVSIAMDDFGTGYSSLSYLRSYPFNVLKIDRSFIKDISVNPADRKLVNATIAMAHSLGLKVVAEGVETEEQLALLVTQGCELAQGYLFSKPVTAEKITKMIEKNKGS